MSPNTRVAVLDDDALFRSLVGAVIDSQSGLSSVCVGDADELEDILGAGDIHCLLLDYHLEDCTGLQAVERISRKVVVPPTILMTGDPRDHIIVEAKRSGVNVALQKQHIKAAPLAAAIRMVAVDRPQASSPPAERRTLRLNVSRLARLEFDGQSLGCTIRNISSGGAGLRLKSYRALAAQFTLVVPEDNFRCRATLRWQLGNDFGVAFI